MLGSSCNVYILVGNCIQLVLYFKIFYFSNNFLKHNKNNPKKVKKNLIRNFHFGHEQFPYTEWPKSEFMFFYNTGSR